MHVNKRKKKREEANERVKEEKDRFDSHVCVCVCEFWPGRARTSQGCFSGAWTSSSVARRPSARPSVPFAPPIASLRDLVNRPEGSHWSCGLASKWGSVFSLSLSSSQCCCPWAYFFFFFLFSFFSIFLHSKVLSLLCTHTHTHSDVYNRCIAAPPKNSIWRRRRVTQTPSRVSYLRRRRFFLLLFFFLFISLLCLLLFMQLCVCWLCTILF